MNNQYFNKKKKEKSETHQYTVTAAITDAIRGSSKQNFLRH